jgi:hypothetical protein
LYCPFISEISAGGNALNPDLLHSTATGKRLLHDHITDSCLFYHVNLYSNGMNVMISRYLNPVRLLTLTGAVLYRSLFLIIFVFAGNNVKAWVYPEHRQIALIAIQQLSPEYRAILEKIWTEARRGHESRLTASVIDPVQGLKPAQIDYAAWFGISGDHSCSPENLLYNILQTRWILEVADISAQLKIDLENSRTSSQYSNAIRESDIRLQRADFEYATRAGSNNVHFLLARQNAKITIDEYLTACYSAGAVLNAFGAYALFHTSAMMKAARYAKGNLNTEQQSALILAALADEAFAQHFLEDGFAAGHIAGTRGTTAVRKGTHDYYNEEGLEVVTWNGKKMVLMGDAYMRPQDARIAATSVRSSLIQFLDAANGKIPVDNTSEDMSSLNQADSFNICNNNLIPSGKAETKYLAEILADMPVPGLASGKGELPRFRAEIGKFFGVSTSVNGAVLFSGYAKQQTQNGFVPGLEADFRYGFGLDGVLNQAGDGLVFLQVGYRLDGSSSNQYYHSGGSDPSNTLTAAIPGRSAFNVRMRLPFYIIPGDLMLAAPVLLFTSPKTLTRMATAAANGGYIPWQSAFATPVGRFQVVLGREVGISFYGLTSPKTILLIQENNEPLTALFYKSTLLDFPILEYRPFRTFSLDQSSSLIIQFSAGFDIPYGASVIYPTNQPLPELQTVWQAGIRFLFNWRHYY